MKVRELIELLQKEKQDAEVRFSETFVSKKFVGERHSCGPEEGSQILGVVAESANYDHADTWEDHVVLQGEVLADVPGPHFAPFDDEEGTQPLVKEVPDSKESAKVLNFDGAGRAARQDHDRRCVSILREPEVKPPPFEISKAHRTKYKRLFEGLKEAKKKNVGFVIIAAPWVLGDNYVELVTNLNIVARAGLKLAVGTLDLEGSEFTFPGTS